MPRFGYSATFYDESTPGSGTAGVGDGNVTSSISYYDAASYSNNVTTLYHYNWRNQLRGIEPEAAPYTVQDVDWMGRTVATARFVAEPTWATVVGDADYAETVTTDRRTLSTIKFDQMNRMYRSSVFAVNSSGTAGNVIVNDTFRDRRSMVVATTASGSGGTEIAYDGAGRQYQSRIVTQLEATKYSSGAFNYRDPLPKLALSDMSGGDDKVIELQHAVLDDTGSVLESVTLRAHHDDTDGLDLSNDDDYVQSAVYSWYDAAHRVTHTADYGTNTNDWKYAALASRPGSAPSSSDTVLVSSYVYGNDGGLSTTTDPKGQVSKTVYDDLGQTRYTIENYDNFNSSTEANTGDVSDKSKDRVTKYAYNGLSAVTELTALDANADGTLSDNQTTKYLYRDVHRGFLVTETIYPDSSDTDHTGTDQVKMTHALDGRPATRTDQRGTVLTFEYDDTFRRPTLQKVTTVGTSVDGAVRAIKREYDTLGRLEKLTSYSDTAATTALNQVAHEYDDMQALAKEYQEHAGTAGGTTPYVQYSYDTTNSAGEFTKGYRLKSRTYPNGRIVHVTYGSASSVSDLLSRSESLNEDSAGSPGDAIVTYSFAGAGVMVRKDYPTPDVRLDYIDSNFATSKSYSGFDRFGRIASQLWRDYGAGSDLFKINHGYDRASNRLYARNTTYPSASQKYSYDGLHRLSSYKAGQIKSDLSDIESFWTRSGQEWTLDALGNQTAVKLWDHESRAFDSWYENDHNGANEITNRRVKGDKGNRGLSDLFSTDTSSEWSKPGSGDAFSVSSGQLTVSTVSQDTIDSVSEDRAQAILLLGERIGPVAGELHFTFPGGTTDGEAGYVFGYKSGADYWLRVARVESSTTKRWRIYHVVNGTRTQMDDRAADPFTIGSEQNLDGVTQRRYIRRAGDVDLSSDSLPSGRMGIYTTVANTTFNDIRLHDDADVREMAGRWLHGAPAPSSSNRYINTTDDELRWYFDQRAIVRPVLLKNLRLQKFQATFKFRRAADTSANTGLSFVFNATDQDDFDFVSIWHHNSNTVPDGHTVEDGVVEASVTTTSSDVNQMPTLASTDPMWVRITNDGTTVSVKIASTEGGLATASDCYTSTNFDNTGGMLGFLAEQNSPAIDELTIKSFSGGSFSVTEHYDAFTLNASNFDEDTLTYDAAGNLTYDGTQKYTYDAWNRLVAVAHAHRDSGGTLQSGQNFVTISYDSQGRRIGKSIINTGYLDATYKYLYDHDSLIETHNGSDIPIKQQVWGMKYIDELVQTSVNTNPQTDTTLDESYWAECSNYNVLGIVDDTGLLVERYEYSPYGQRTVYFSPGSNDASLNAPTNVSRRVVAGGTAQPYGINDVGHQGLMHDEETSLIYNRARMLSPAFQRFIQKDLLEFADGMNSFEYVRSNPIQHVDPSGLRRARVPTSPLDLVGFMIDHFADDTPFFHLGPWPLSEFFGADDIIETETGPTSCQEGCTLVLDVEMVRVMTRTVVVAKMDVKNDGNGNVVVDPSKVSAGSWHKFARIRRTRKCCCCTGGERLQSDTGENSRKYSQGYSDEGEHYRMVLTVEETWTRFHWCG